MGHGKILEVGLVGGLPNSHPTVVFQNPTNPIKLDLYRMTVHNSNNRYYNLNYYDYAVDSCLFRSDLNEEIDAFVLHVEHWFLKFYINIQ